jgi:hypothetical protein
MDESTKYVKTAKGIDEVERRSRTLPMKLRTMLILIDGSKTVRELVRAAAAISAPADFIQVLESGGFIVPAKAAAEAARADAAAAAAIPNVINGDADRFYRAQRFMNETGVNALGFRALFLTLKLERAATLDDLRALLPDYTKAITKGSGPEEARLLAQRAREMLG